MGLRRLHACFFVVQGNKVFLAVVSSKVANDSSFALEHKHFVLFCEVGNELLTRPTDYVRNVLRPIFSTSYFSIQCSANKGQSTAKLKGSPQ